ncbi:MAG: futalosine hydrolase [Planctomycetota bacterium]
MHALRQTSPRLPWLLAAAAPAEARAVAARFTDAHTDAIDRAAHHPWRTLPLSDRLHLLVTGVGPACAAAAVAHTYRPDAHAGLCILGVAGALPDTNLSIADLVVATTIVDAHTGIRTNDGFQDTAQMGFPPLPALEHNTIAADHDALDTAALPAHTPAPIATVTTCSATDALARDVATRTAAACEAMEGFAAAATAKRLAPDRPVLELRVISNTTGDRARQEWDLPRALRALSDLARTL